MQRDHIEIAVSVDSGILSNCLCQVAELLPHTAHRVQDWTNPSKLASLYCLLGTDEKGFLLLPLEAIVHQVGHYSLSVISVNAVYTIVAEA